MRPVYNNGYIKRVRFSSEHWIFAKLSTNNSNCFSFHGTKLFVFSTHFLCSSCSNFSVLFLPIAKNFYFILNNNEVQNCLICWWLCFAVNTNKKRLLNTIYDLHINHGKLSFRTLFMDSGECIVFRLFAHFPQTIHNNRLFSLLKRAYSRYTHCELSISWWASLRWSLQRMS